MRLVALENIDIDNVWTVPTVKSRKADTSAPMETGMAAKDDGKTREKMIKESWTSHNRLFTKGLAKENGVSERVSIRMEKGTMVAKVAEMEERISGKRARKAKGKNMVAREKALTWLTFGKGGHTAARCRTAGDKNWYAIEESSEHIEEANGSDEDLPAWCLLEESENEQRQEAVSRREKQKMKTANQVSLSSMEGSHNLKA